MAKKVVTNDGKKGGWLVGKRHYDKNGKSLGGIKAVVTDAGGKPVELEGGEVIINREASKKYWKELSKINQSAGNGVAIEPPTDAFDEDPAEDYENGGKIEFNANHIPNKWILNYAIKIKEEHPDIWALGGNIFGNQAFVNLKRVAERGHWLDSEEWMYKKWRSFVARHQGDFRIQGVIAMLKWVDKVDKGWQYMKNLIEEEIKKREARKSKKMSHGGKMETGGWVQKPIKIKPDVYKFEDHQGVGYIVKRGVGDRITPMWVVSTDEEGTWDGMNELFYTKKAAINYIESFFEKGGKMSNGGNLSKTPAPTSERIKGSKTNAKGTAKDSTSGEDINFDDKTIASIQSLIDSHNEKYPSKKITLGVAKAVVRRGMGAYSSSHRPTITGGKPNSRTAWGLARLKAFIHKAEKGKSKSGKYSQDNDLFDDLDITVSKFDNGGNVNDIFDYQEDYYEPKKYGEVLYKFKNENEDEFNVSLTNIDKKRKSLVIDFEGNFSWETMKNINPFKTLSTLSSILKYAIKKLSNDGFIINTLIYDATEKKAKIYKLLILKEFPNSKFTINQYGSYEVKLENESNLTPEQYKLVRTPEFKRWFGDWENDPANASKVVDENGEPMVVEHNTNYIFNVFQKNKIGSNTDSGYYGKGFYFAPIGKGSKNYGKYTLYCFLNIKNPIYKTANELDPNNQQSTIVLFGNFDFGTNKYRSEKESKEIQEIVVFEPEQIKLADGSNTTFDINNPDIRFSHGGSIELEKGIKAEYEHAKTIAQFKREGVSVRDVARSIAEDHIKEDPHYYSKLEKMEGKKFATGGIVENGISINIGDTGLYGRSNDQITITGITPKIVNFITSDGKKKGIYIDSFAKNYIPDNASNYVKSGSSQTATQPSQASTSEWRVKTLDELKSQGLFKKDQYRGITDFTINNWNGNKVVSIDSKAISSLESGKNNFSFDGFYIGRELFTEDPLPSPQSNVVHELANYRIRTEQEFINEYGKNWQKQVGWVTKGDSMDWLLGEKITDIVTTDRYDTILELVKNGSRFESDFSTKNIIDVYWSITPYMYMFDPVLYSQNVGANVSQNQQKDLRPSTNKDVLDATFNVGDVVYIRKDKADFLDIDFDSNDNVFKIVTEKFEPTSKSPQNKTGKIYRIEQIKNVAIKRIFELEGKDIAIVDINQTKQKEFGNYILKKNVTQDDLENIKIIVDTEEKSKAFQKLVLDLGIPWFNGLTSIEYLNKPYLFIEKYSDIPIYLTFASNTKTGKDYYEGSSYKEIKFDDLFELKSQAKPVLSDESLKELFKDVKEIDKEREALESIPQKNETQINDELKSLEDEYNDLLFLIDLTPSTDVDNMLSLKLQAKQLKDRIDLLHLDLKKKIDGELQLLDNLFNASSIQPQERYKFNAYNDGFAPDGQATSLPKNLYDWTMTQEFQNWFGNFTNAYNYRNSSYENVPCSVIVNKHYEPLVVYHGTGAEFSFFKFDKFPAMYFAENEAYSNWFAEMKGQQSGTNGYVYPFFLNIRTPLDLTIYGINPVSPDEFIDWMFLQTGLDADELKISKALLDPSQKFQAWMYLRNSPEMLNVLRDKAICDGIIYYEDNPSVDKSSDAYQTKAYIVFNSNSAKIADPNREMMTIPAMRSFYLKRGGKL